MFAKRLWLLPAAPALLVSMMHVLPLRADIISDWNDKAETIAAEKRVLPPPNARAIAILHLAQYEAVNAVAQRYLPYRVKLASTRDASLEAAAAAAGHDVLVALYPDQRAALDAMLNAALSAPSNSEAKRQGVQVGQDAAAAILALRANDGVTSPEAYHPFTAPGVYVPTMIPVSSTDGRITPFAMTAPTQFRPAPPPALNSQTWTDDLNEIREWGGRSSTKRTAEQTDIARFWFLTGPRAWSPIVRQLVAPSSSISSTAPACTP